jgi:DNA replication protein DnaC
MNINQVWVEKYRPKSIEEMILSEKNREHFSNLTEIPNNLLFVGNPGCGKTTLRLVYIGHHSSKDSYTADKESITKEK